MNDEARTRLELQILGLQAQTAVLERIQTQFIVQVAAQLAERPPEFIRAFMIHVEDGLRADMRAASGEDRIVAENAMAFFESYSADLIATLTPKQRPQ